MQSKIQQQIALERELNLLEPRLRRQFQVAISLLKREINLQELADAIRTRNLDYISQVFNDRTMTMAFQGYIEEIKNSQIKGAALAVAALPLFRFQSGTQLEVRFNVTNPRTATFLESYAMDKVRQVSNDIRENIRKIINQSVIGGENPLNAATRVRAVIGLTARQDAAVAKFEQLLRAGEAGALQRELRDKRFDPSVAAALRGDRPLKEQQIQKMTQRYRERYLRYRSQTIARTESIRALESGKSLLIDQKINEGMISSSSVRRFWINTNDEKLRDSHRQIPEMNPDGVGLNEPFKSPLGYIMHPGDPNATAENTINCRCTTFIQVISQ